MKINFTTQRPKLFWLIMLVVLATLLFGVPSVVLVVVTQSQLLQKIVFYSVLMAWLIGMALICVYWARQFSGKYIGMKPRPVFEQIW